MILKLAVVVLLTIWVDAVRLASTDAAACEAETLEWNFLAISYPKGDSYEALYNNYSGAAQTVHVGIVGADLRRKHPAVSSSNSYYQHFYDADHEDLSVTTFEMYVNSTAAASIIADSEEFCGESLAHRAKWLSMHVSSVELTAATDGEVASAMSWRSDRIPVMLLSLSVPLESSIPLTLKQVEHNAERSNEGKGVFMVVGSGDGGLGTCTYNSLANSPYTIVVGATNRLHDKADYSSSCSAILVSAPGGDSKAGIPSASSLAPPGSNEESDLCYDDWFGTRAAAAHVAGLAAHILTLRPSLGWRDIKWIIATTATNKTCMDGGWTLNAAGYAHSLTHGYGVVNTTAALYRAKAWAPLPPMSVVKSRTLSLLQPIPIDGSTVSSSYLNVNNITIEEVAVTVSIQFQNPNHLEISLISPSGTKSLLSPFQGVFETIILEYGNKKILGQSADFGTIPSLARVRSFAGVISKVSHADACSGSFHAVGDGFILRRYRDPKCSMDQQILNIEKKKTSGSVVVIIQNYEDAPFRAVGGVKSKAIILGISLSDGNLLEKYTDTGFKIYPNMYEREDYMRAPIPTLLPWTFSTSAFLGEYAGGVWMFNVVDAWTGRETSAAVVLEWQMHIHGHCGEEQEKSNCFPSKVPELKLPGSIHCAAVTEKETPCNVCGSCCWELTDSQCASCYLEECFGYHDPLLSDQLAELVVIGAIDPMLAAINDFSPRHEVVVGIVADGVQASHPELAYTIREDLSYDFLQQEVGSSVLPDWDGSGTGGQGTLLAGILAGVGNNDKCGVGAAVNSVGIASLRVFGPYPRNSVYSLESALRKNMDSISVYLNSWELSRSGTTLGKMPNSVMAAIQFGTEEGRNGLGSMYVIGSGSGGENGDSCNYDSVTNSPYTFTVGSLGKSGKIATYSERCDAVLVAAPGGDSEGGLVSADLVGAEGLSEGDCVDSSDGFFGPSAAAAYTSSVIAHILKAAPMLTWRDVQHVLVKSSSVVDVAQGGWGRNGANFNYSSAYGFGVVNSTAAIALAKNWTAVDPLVVYRPPATTTPLALFGSLLDNLSPIRVEDVLDLEYVRVTVDISHPYPNNLNIQLISPAGTRSRLADRHGIYELISLVITESSSTPIKTNINFIPAVFGLNSFSSWEVMSGVYFTAVGKNVCKPYSVHGQTVIVVPEYDAVANCSMEEKARLAAAAGAKLLLVESKSGQPHVLHGNRDSTIFVGMVSGADANVLRASGASKLGLTRKYTFAYPALPPYSGWTFGSLRFWGESSKGTWTLSIKDHANSGSAKLNSWSIELYGAKGRASLRPKCSPWFACDTCFACCGDDVAEKDCLECVDTKCKFSCNA